jgi:ATP-binding cassette subfamily B protein
VTAGARARRTAPEGELAVLARLLRQARPYWRHIALAFGVSALATPLALLAPFPLKIVVDHVIGSEPLPGFLAAVLPDVAQGSRSALVVVAVAMVLMVALLMQAQSLLGTWLRLFVGERLLLEFRARLFQAVQRLSIAYHDTRGSSDSLYRIQYDATSIRSYTVDGLLPLAISLLTLTGMLYVTWVLDPVLALIALAISPALYLLTVAYRRRLRAQWREVKELESAAMSVVQETLGAVRLVKAFGQEDREQERFLSRSGRSLAANLATYLSQAWYGVLLGLITAAGTAAVLYVGIRHVQSGTLSLGGLLVVMTYLAQLYEPLKTIGQKVTNLQNAFAGAERAFAVLDERPEVEERSDARPLARAAGELVFENVTFGYAREHPVLHDVSFRVAAGSRLGVMGTTGSGKTTLVSLLLRFFDPQVGRLLLDGDDLRDVRLDDLRRQFAVVAQDTVLFSTTIEENIRYARPDASTEEVVAAARSAGAEDFIGRLPEDYATVVGERGMRLSGGERQRVSLARAFLKDAPILILDEPTSSLDLATERTVMEAIATLMHHRTTLMIAHRPATLGSCDAILTMERGRVREISTRVEETLEAALGLDGKGPGRLAVVPTDPGGHGR